MGIVGRIAMSGEPIKVADAMRTVSNTDFGGGGTAKNCRHRIRRGDEPDQSLPAADEQLERRMIEEAMPVMRQ